MDQVYALFEAGQLHEAEMAARKVVEREPANVLAMNVLGVIAHHVGRNDLAIQWLSHAIKVNPAVAMLYNNLGEAYRALNDGTSAIACYEAAIARDASYLQPRDNLGIVYACLGELEKAVEIWRQVLAIKPDFDTAANNLGNALLELGYSAEAAQWHRRALEIDTRYSWAGSNLLRDLNFTPDISGEHLLAESRQWWQRHGAELSNSIASHSNDPTPDRPLIVGFVSADLRMHSVTYFLEPIFQHHDRQLFKYIAYADLATEDEVSRRLKSQVEGWRSIRGIGDEPVADRVRTDQVDILIDLSGHTSGNRARVFARKPAPVQISYLGYPATTGIETIEYRITDALADPPGMTDGHYTEKLLRLPRTAWCYRPPPDAPDVAELPARVHGYVTFGSFNNWPKVNDRVIDVWAKILRQVHNARLMLKTNGLREMALQRRVREMFTARGVDPGRLTLVSKDAELKDHLRKYGEVDIALDPFPYNGTTTTCEAMWMGVPVITLEGRMHLSRVGVSLLSNVGLRELIAGDEDDYVARAVALAGDLDRLASLRRGLRERMEHSPLRDEKQMANDFNAAIQVAWREWCSSR
jgi:predicted O-linked N-acetylglucosamine transferase (SPINDLY family)